MAVHGIEETETTTTTLQKGTLITIPTEIRLLLIPHPAMEIPAMKATAVVVIPAVAIHLAVVVIPEGATHPAGEVQDKPSLLRPETLALP